MKQPNIVMIVGEDLGRHLGCYGDPCVHTPHLDRLASEGCRYERAYSTSPVCSPSRATLVSGQYPIKLGTHQHRSTLAEPPRLFTHELRETGYEVHWPGKLDFNFTPSPDFCDSREPWLAALRQGRLSRRPFFAYCNIGTTHESGLWPLDVRNAEGQRPPHMPRPESRPPRRHEPADVAVPAYLPDEQVVREDIARYYDAVAALDAQVGGILEALDESGVADDTVVMMLSDHGRGLPREKRWLYAAGIHMPLIIRWPGRIKAGLVEQRLVSWVDIAPTILALAGATIPEEYDGQPFLGQADVRPRSHAFAGRDRMDLVWDRSRAVTDGTYLYIRNFAANLPWAQPLHYQDFMPTMLRMRELHAEGLLQGAASVFMADRKPEEELYCLADDPDCVCNLADRPECGTVLQRLRRRLDDWLVQTNDLGAVDERVLEARGVLQGPAGETSSATVRRQRVAES